MLALLYVHDTASEDRPALDIPGGALATAGLGALTWGLTMGSGRERLDACWRLAVSPRAFCRCWLSSGSRRRAANGP